MLLDALLRIKRTDMQRIELKLDRQYNALLGCFDDSVAAGWQTPCGYLALRTAVTLGRSPWTRCRPCLPSGRPPAASSSGTPPSAPTSQQERFRLGHAVRGITNLASLVRVRIWQQLLEQHRTKQTTPRNLELNEHLTPEDRRTLRSCSKQACDMKTQGQQRHLIRPSTKVHGARAEKCGGGGTSSGVTSASSPAEALYLRLRTSVSAAASLNSFAFFTAAASFSCSHSVAAVTECCRTGAELPDSQSEHLA